MKPGNVHFIAIGGAVMHNLALDLASLGYTVSGSDDEIYEPAFSRLEKHGLLPREIGWFPQRIHQGLDFIVLGMHAKKDNPELVKALELGIPIYSYPELVRKLSDQKTRIVIAGSHGKTTITSMILHVFKKWNLDFDYLVGAQITGFDKMVKLSEAPIIVIEGDEYLSSPLDMRSKFLHYQPDISVLTGIAWDHINVFPTYEEYFNTFIKYLETFSSTGKLIFYAHDAEIKRLLESSEWPMEKISYEALPRADYHNFVQYNGQEYPISFIGEHNLSNLAAALSVVVQLGFSAQDFLSAISDFTGASKRLQKISDRNGRVIYLDFAHAPSKVKATTQAFSKWFPAKPTLAVFELHTFSSLDEKFMPQYNGSMESANHVVVFYSKHTLSMKSKPMPDDDWIKKCFSHPNLTVLSNKSDLKILILSEDFHDHNILLMTSGNFESLDLTSLE